MANDDLVFVIHTAITQFGCISIDDFVEFVFWLEAHTETAEIARNKFLVKVGREIQFVQIK